MAEGQTSSQPGPTGTDKAGSVPAEGYNNKCIFCRIVNNEMDTELLHRTWKILPSKSVHFRICIAFKGTSLMWTRSCMDIKPGAPQHYLVVPTKHVGNCKSLNIQHVPLVKQLVDVGKDVLQKHNVTDLTDVRFGFHWPPFCSVTHLHLHVLAPASQMGFMSRLIYRLNSYWFITADQLIEHLNSKAETH